MSTAYPRRLLSTWLLLLFTATCAWAAGTNVTIDDVYGDPITGQVPVYYPPDLWKRGDTCKECLLKTTSAWRNTWHDATQHSDDPEVRTFSVNFTGTAVYVYNIISSYTFGGKPTIVYMTFDIDGERAGEFYRENITRTEHRVNVYAKTDLPNGPHSLVVRVPAGRDGTQWSWVLFDYLVYTTELASAPPPKDDPPPDEAENSNKPGASSPSPSPVGAIVGGVVGGLAALLAVAFAVWFLVRRRKRRAAEYASTPATWDNPHSPMVYAPAPAPIAPVSRKLASGASHPSHSHAASSYARRPSDVSYQTSSIPPHQSPSLIAQHSPSLLPQQTPPLVAVRPGASPSGRALPSSGTPSDVNSSEQQLIHAQRSAIDLQAQRLRELEERLAAVESPPSYHEGRY